MTYWKQTVTNHHHTDLGCQVVCPSPLSSVCFPLLPHSPSKVQHSRQQWMSRSAVDSFDSGMKESLTGFHRLEEDPLQHRPTRVWTKSSIFLSVTGKWEAAEVKVSHCYGNNWVCMCWCPAVGHLINHLCVRLSCRCHCWAKINCDVTREWGERSFGNGSILWTFDWRPNKMTLHL